MIVFNLGYQVCTALCLAWQVYSFLAERNLQAVRPSLEKKSKTLFDVVKILQLMFALLRSFK